MFLGAKLSELRRKYWMMEVRVRSDFGLGSNLTLDSLSILAVTIPAEPQSDSGLKQ
jgi:hypothetical protein